MLTVLWVLLAALLISTSLILLLSFGALWLRFAFATSEREDEQYMIELDPDTEEPFFCKN